MPCYNYSSNDPIYYSPNAGQWAVEKVYSVGATYSFAAIARMCEIPAQDQLCVYTRASAGSAETKLTLNIDYTVNTVSETITLIAPPASGQVVVRRCTPNDKMLFEFVDGAKITAGQLNGSLYQLLFLGQEKEWVGSINNHHYPVAANVVAWNSGTAYVVGNYVTSSNVVYQCIQAHTNQTPPNATYWTPVNFITNGFVIQGGENLGGPVRFDLTGVSNGYSLVWNGTKFEAGTIGGFIDNLQDVIITNAGNTHILVYDSLVSKWKNYLPSVDIRENNLKFKDFTFYNRQGNNTDQSYSNGETAISAPAALDIFKNGSNEYVLTHAPTVYHILKKIIPSEQDPVAFFNNVNTQINNFAASLANPVKVQLYWNLARNIASTATIVDDTTGEALVNFKIAFWDSPHELYHASMWTSIDSLKYHGVTASGSSLYKQNAYFSVADGTRISKLYGKGIKANGFYLNVPECYTTAWCNIPVTQNTNPITFTTTSNINLINMTTPINPTYRDEYLTALRDYAFAGARAGLAATSNNLHQDYNSRLSKAHLLNADYLGIEDISYKRLESSDTAQSCLFKIPKQMVYYNKLAMAFHPSYISTLTTGGTNWPVTNIGETTANGSTFSKDVRFNGSGDLLYGTLTTQSTLSESGMGSIYKSNSFWGNWCRDWSSNPGLYKYNEADIDWYIQNVGPTDQLRLIDLETTITVGADIFVSGVADELTKSSISPWLYRPNWYDKTNASLDGRIGTHFFNLDSNNVFSTASNFVPDPRDEYVFRVVIKDELFSVFDKAGSTTISSAIILEHGFNEHPSNALSNTTHGTLAEIYRKNATPLEIQRARSRLNKNDVKVFVQSEHFEYKSGTSGDRQYVVNLCISVPRLKSIGYAKVFRAPVTNQPTVYENASIEDTDKDLGPWTFYLENDFFTTPEGADYGVGMDTISLNTFNAKKIAVAGRNECAVKFTRLGIPSNLWIRMSILNTDGTTSLVDAGGMWNTSA